VIVAQRLTDRKCEKHPDSLLVEVLIHSEKLQNDWVVAICPDCKREADEQETVS
jgi:hypothetical protein